MKNVDFEYQSPRKVDDNLWEVRGSWRNKLGRRMTVVRLRDKRLILHSSIRLKPKDMDWLAALGEPAFIIAPNIFHCSDAGWMAEKFPTAEVFVPKKKIPFFKGLGLRPKDLHLEFPTALSSEVKCLPMHGTRIEEAAFLHIPTRTLILCDLAFNMGPVFSGLEKILMNWNRVGGQFGPSRLTKILFATDRNKLIASYQDLLKEDFDRVIVNHGEILDSGGHAQLKEGVQRIFGSH